MIKVLAIKFVEIKRVLNILFSFDGGKILTINSLNL
jgi:hypothetical protein